MSKKVLVLGLGQNNFLSYLYSKLKKYDSNFHITVPFFYEITPNVVSNNWMYENDKVNFQKSRISFLQSFFYCLFSKHFYSTFFFILLVEKKIGKALHFCKQQLLAKSFFIQNKNFQEYDTFHFHFMQYSYLRELFLVPKNKKIVCTFWGSDLLRTNDILNFYFVKKALNNASIITCQSEELKEIILSKFGRNLITKIEISMFPVPEKTFDLIDLNSNNNHLIKSFKANNGYAQDKINILIGHSGSIFNNHLKIISSLKDFSKKNKIHLIINLNYAITENEKITYKQELIKALNQVECSYTVLEKFFVDEELALSRLASDVFIHAPISDALSGTMLELLYASNVVITGSWLPYKTFRKAKLNYYEISDFQEISSTLDLIVENFELEKEAQTANKFSIRNYFMSEKITEKWAEILN
ncbi:hypothetical protein OX283_012520 [Flavobacterium sp. SUN052]|uniref:glycosyltransferase n=1 Tax=Flavobacterium sp. SUN052 TaxID=3002441 RepID=UPI00237EA29F|nr:hypothetical protein [Flavobacterium sp. SUN052]MEC4005486.1 hypothetical protein [Flavobacterium sp. SUN052]